MCELCDQRWHGKVNTGMSKCRVCVCVHSSNIGHMYIHMYIPTGTHSFTCQRKTKENPHLSLTINQGEEREREYSCCLNCRQVVVVLFTVHSEGKHSESEWFTCDDNKS